MFADQRRHCYNFACYVSKIKCILSPSNKAYFRNLTYNFIRILFIIITCREYKKCSKDKYTRVYKIYIRTNIHVYIKFILAHAKKA